MNRSRRIIFNSLTALSLLLCLGIVLLWQQSFHDGGECWNIGSRLRGRHLGISSFEGAISIHYLSGALPMGARIDSYLEFPHWAGALATAIVPAIWIVFRIRARRLPAAPHACSRCGYDLRATPERCPECGTIPAKAKR